MFSNSLIWSQCFAFLGVSFVRIVTFELLGWKALCVYSYSS